MLTSEIQYQANYEIEPTEKRLLPQNILFILTQICDYVQTLKQCFYKQNMEKYENKYLDNLDSKEEICCTLIDSLSEYYIILEQPLDYSFRFLLCWEIHSFNPSKCQI